MSKPPLQRRYQQIAVQIRDQILRGEVPSDGRLESERVLGDRYQVQRNTIRQALAMLEEEGHILTKGRRGSFVCLPKAQSGPKTVLVNLHQGSGPNLVSLVNSLTHELDRAGFHVKRTYTDPLPDSSFEQVPDPEALPADTAGVVLWPHYPANIPKLKRLSEAVPLVLVDRRLIGVPADCIRFDDIVGGQVVAEHLLSQGHRRIGFLTDEVFAETVQNRWHGYVLAHEAYGIAVDPRLSFLFQEMDLPRLSVCLKQLLSDPVVAPTAIMCSNDLVAFTLMRLLHELGARVPEEVAVTGYGNGVPDYAEAMTLTSVHQPFDEVGRVAARILMERIGQVRSERLERPHDVTIPVSLIPRGTSAAK